MLSATAYHSWYRGPVAGLGEVPMPLPKRSRDGNQLAKLVVDMAAGELPNEQG